MEHSNRFSSGKLETNKWQIPTTVVKCNISKTTILICILNTFQPLANVNLGAIVLAIMVAIAGAAIGGFSKFFQAGNSATMSSFFSFPNAGNSFGRG